VHLVDEEQRRHLEERLEPLDEHGRIQPSTMRWSKLEERLNIDRGTNVPSRHTGRICILFTPITATSGWLMSGVVISPPRAPSEVIVIVDR